MLFEALLQRLWPLFRCLLGLRQTIFLILELLLLNFVFQMKKSSVFHPYKVYLPNFGILTPLYIYLVLHICVVFRLFCELLHDPSFGLHFLGHLGSFVQVQRVLFLLLLFHLEVERILDFH